jgi:hypothetical protein
MAAKSNGGAAGGSARSLDVTVRSRRNPGHIKVNKAERRQKL